MTLHHLSPLDPQAAPATRPTERKINDFSALSASILSSGLMRRRYGYYWAKLIALPLAYAACFGLFILLGNTWWQLFTAALFAFVFTQTAFLGHDAAHRQIFRSGRWNDWVTLVIGDLFVGMSVGWWQHKHTKHHGNPNKIGTDGDIGIPVVVRPENSSQLPLVNWILRHQGSFFFPFLLIEGIGLHVASIRRVTAKEKVPRRAVEITFMSVRLFGYLGLVFWVLSPGKAGVFLGVQLALFGFYMGAAFATNHMGMPLVPKTMRLDFLRRQVLMSRNIRGNVLMDIAMGGLNYQIEHHLFPSMPRIHLRRAAPMIEAYCQEKDVAYLSTNLRDAFGSVIRYVDDAGLGKQDVFACPLVTQRAYVGAATV